MNWSEHFIRWSFFQICSGINNNTLLLYACEVIHLINKGVISPYVQEWGGILLKFNILRLHNATHYCAWMSAFLKQPWRNTRSSLCIIWENNLETLEKLFSMIQSRCSIYSHFLKPLHSNIHELWHQTLMIMKISVEDFEKIVKSPHFFHIIFVNWLVLKIRLCFEM